MVCACTDTHRLQPIETVAHFRALPNCNVWRPADGNETSAAYYMAMTSTRTPSILWYVQTLCEVV